MKTVFAIILIASLLLIGCGRAAETPELIKPEDVIQSFKEALSRGEVNTCLSLVSDNVVYRQDPVGLTFEGKEQVKGILTYLTAWNFDWSATSLYNVIGNRVSFSADMHGEHYKLLGMELVRARLEFLIQDGKIVSILVTENEEDSAKLDELTKGGIGVRFEWEEEDGAERGIRVLEVFQDSPAQKAGIEAGDLIVAVDRISCSQMTRPQEVLFRIIGPMESKVLLTIIRESLEEPISIEVKRAQLR